MAHSGPAAAHAAGPPARLQHPRGPLRALRRLLPHRQRVLLRPAPEVLQLHPELLPDGEAAPGGRDVRARLQRRPRVLGRGRALPGVVLPAQVPPAEGARARGDAEGGGVAAAAGRGGVRGRQVLAVPEVAVGHAGEADHLDRGQGESGGVPGGVE